MPEHPNRVATRPEHVCLTDGRAVIHARADREAVTLSAVIETLARLGLLQGSCDALSPAPTAQIVGVVRADLARSRALQVW